MDHIEYRDLSRNNFPGGRFLENNFGSFLTSAHKSTSTIDIMNETSC